MCPGALSPRRPWAIMRWRKEGEIAVPQHRTWSQKGVAVMAADFLDNGFGLFAVNVLQQGSGDDENHLFLIEIPQNDAGNAN